MAKFVISTVFIIFFAQFSYSQSSAILFSGKKKTEIFVNDKFIGIIGLPTKSVMHLLENGTHEIRIQDKKGNEFTERVKIDSNSFYEYDTRILIRDYSKENPVTGIVEVKSMDAQVFFIVDEMPLFNGGEAAIEFRKFIAENLTYPEEAALKGIEGRVIVQFAVNGSGYVEDVEIVRSVEESLDKEAIRVVSSSPQWTPGSQRGMPVKVLFYFPINYQLNKEELKKQ